MLSERITNMQPSATIEMEGRVAQLRSEGVNIISLNAGEPDFDTPENIKKACFDALEANKTRYVTVSGIAELKKAICAKLKRDNNVDYEPAEIVVSTGAKQALYNATLAICQAGDEVIVPIPCWVSYVEIIKLAESKPVLIPTLDNFGLDIAEVEKAITPKTKAIIINSPNNPTGAVYTEESLKKLVDLAVKHNFYIISDEVYEKLIYGDSKHVCPASFSAEAKEHVIVINGMSKAYAMTGWRLGYSASSKAIARGISSLQGHTTSNSTTFVQWAGVEALNGPQDSVTAMVKEYAKRREYLLGRLRAMGGITCENADGAFYLMPNVSSYYGKKTPNGDVIKDSNDFCNYILDEAHVACVMGSAFEAPDNIRIAYSNSMENIEKAMDAFEAAVKKLA